MSPRIHQTSRERESKVDTAPPPGHPFEMTVCACKECGRLLTRSSSVSRGCGPTCYAKAQGARYQRELERAGQATFAFVAREALG